MKDQNDKIGWKKGVYPADEFLRESLARRKKAVRLDILGTNTAAERLYTKCGFRFVEAKTMFYEDIGWTECKMFELGL